MSGLLKNVKLSKVATASSQEYVSLEELLLAEDSAAVQQAVEQQQQEETEATTSRKSRRKKIKSNRVVAKKRSSKSKQVEQVRKQKLYEKRNRDALLKRQKQSNQKNQSGSRSKRSEFSGKVSKKAKKSQILEEASRPVVLASVNFHPCFDAEGTLAPAGELLKIKRSIRRLTLDTQVAPIISRSQVFDTPELATLLIEYTSARKEFLNSLSPSSINGFEEALSALGLTLDMNVSNTETLYTLLREFALAMKAGSARLDESSSRSLDGSTKLVSEKDKIIESYISALKSLRSSAFEDMLVSDSQDIEVSLKCLLSLLSKEITFSYNMKKQDINYKSIDPTNSTRTKYKASVLDDPDILRSRFSVFGIVFRGDSATDPDSKKPTVNYPYESIKVLPKKFKTKSSIDFLEGLIASSVPAPRYFGKPNPYAGAVSKIRPQVERLTSLTNKSELEFNQSVYVELMNSILSSILTNLQSSKSSATNASQCHILRAAANDSSVMGLLFVYLAFRSERMGNSDTTPQDTVTSSTYLKQLMSMTGAGVIEKQFKIEPQNIELDPGVDGTTSFNAPSESQTATLQTTPTENEDSLLESKFDTTFEQVCEALARKVNNYFYYNSPPEDTFTSASEVSINSRSVEEALVDLATEDSIFDYLLSYSEVLDSALPARDSDVDSIFTSGRTHYSGFIRRHVFSAFTMSVSKIMKICLDSRSSVVTSGKQASVQLKSASSVKYAKNIKHKTKGKVKGTKSKSKKKPSTPPTLTINFSSDYASALSDLQSYLNSDPLDFDEVSDTYPLLSSIGASLLEEENFISEFLPNILDYLVTVNDNFDKVDAALDRSIEGVSLRKMLASGTTLSRDLAKTLKYFTLLLNDENMQYSGYKFNDGCIGKTSLDYLLNELKQQKYRTDKRIFVVGIPVGFLEETTTTPAEISEIRKSSGVYDPDTFELVVQKIDQARPDLEYEDLRFKFSRSLFISGNAKLDPNISKISDDLASYRMPVAKAEIFFGKDVVDNHRTDFLLKQYCDLQLDLDFFESAFPKSPKAMKQVTNGIVDISPISNVPQQGLSFLSASNLAFDPSKRSLDSFPFYSAENSLLEVSKKNAADVYTLSAFEYANSYGSFFQADKEQDKYSRGLEFEKILCIIIDDDQFKRKYEVKGPGDREINAEMRALKMSEKLTSIGQPSSYGVDLNTYRFFVSMEEE